jgi:Tfp pilus assembly protein PilO
MLFFSRSNKLLQWVAPIKTHARYLITIALCATLTSGWWFGIYTPLRTMNVSYAQQNKMVCQQCDTTKQERQLVASLENTVKGLQYDLDIYSVKTSYEPKEVQINDIVSAIQASGLSLSAYKVEKEIDKKLYTKAIMRLSLSGGHQQLLNFFAQMHTKKILVSCNNISLQAASQAGNYAITCELASFSYK